ncbi:MAG: hypothetical protein AAFX50_25950 [Acidobacteriota bacterium]
MRIVATGDGSHFLAWVDDAFDGESFTIRGREIGPDGALIGDEFPVGQWPSGALAEAAIDVDAGGRLVVVWSSATSPGADDSGSSIQARRFLATSDGVRGLHDRR